MARAGSQSLRAAADPPPPPLWRRLGVALRTPTARVGRRAENKGRLSRHPGPDGAGAADSHQLNAGTPGAAAGRSAAVQRPRGFESRLPCCFHGGRRDFDTCGAEASLRLLGEHSCGQGAEGLGELAGATVLGAARAEHPPRRSRFPSHLPAAAAGCAPGGGSVASSNHTTAIRSPDRRRCRGDRRLLGRLGAEHLNMGVAFGDSSLPGPRPPPPVSSAIFKSQGAGLRPAPTADNRGSCRRTLLSRAEPTPSSSCGRFQEHKP